jgi:hypothetical protein
MKRVSKKWSKNGSFRVSRGPRNPQKLTFWRQNIKFGILGCPKMTHFWPKSGKKWAIFWTLFLSFLTPFHVEGSYLVVREMAQKWAKNGVKNGSFWGTPGGSKNGHSGKTEILSYAYVRFCQFLSLFLCQIWRFCNILLR